MSDEKGLAKRVRLFNRGTETFNYEILGERYVIPAGESIELPRRTAIAVRGFYPGKDIPVSLEMCPVEGDYDGPAPEILTNKEKVTVYSCYKCDAEFASKEELVAHMKAIHTPGKKAQPEVQG